MQVASVVRGGDSPLQPHHIFAVNNLLDDAVHAAIHIAKPGLFSFNIILPLTYTVAVAVAV